MGGLKQSRSLANMVFKLSNYFRMPYSISSVDFMAVFQSSKLTLQGLQALLATLISSDKEGEAASSFILSGHSMVSCKRTQRASHG